MKTINLRKLSNQKGLTLIEVLVSLVIISIILIAVLFVLLQIIRTNKTSQEIVNATYVAQTEMEEMYRVSQNEDFDVWISDLSSTNKNYTFSENIHTITYQTENHHEIEIKINETDQPPLKRITIYVFELGQSESSSPKAKMENLLEWGPGP